MVNLISKHKVKKSMIKFSLITLLSGAGAVALAPTVVDAAGTSYNHGHTGYDCYKMNYYISPSTTKSLARQTSSLNNAAAIANFIGLTGLTAGIITLVFGSAVSANNVFVQAANQGKGVQVSYVAHFSLLTTHTYNSTPSYVIR